MLAQKLTELRRAAADRLCQDVLSQLRALGMEKATFRVAFADRQQTEEPQENGMDALEFLLSANPGEPLRPLAKVASGGELSRIMLGFKAIFADNDRIGTLIFDEIDTGVSGRVSAAIGRKMHSIGEYKQVITITHSPQVAAAGDQRYLVAKQVKDGATFTQVGPLTKEETITAIAQMMAGSDVTDAAKQNGVDLMKSFKEK